jgi:hypothetical protein
MYHAGDVVFVLSAFVDVCGHQLEILSGNYHATHHHQHHRDVTHIVRSRHQSSRPDVAVLNEAIDRYQALMWL